MPHIDCRRKAPVAAVAILSLLAFSFFALADDQSPELVETDFDNVAPFSDQVFRLPPGTDGVSSDYRKTWTRLTGFEFSGLHWNNFVVIYVNKNPEVYSYNYREYVKTYVEDDWDDWEDEEEEATESGFQHYEIGTIFLKEHFISKDGRPTDAGLITLMEKKAPGYDPEYEDWEYTWIDGANGNLIARGGSENKSLFANCIDCHSNMSERDYVFSTYSRLEYP